jgi:hypothetical protein
MLKVKIFPPLMVGILKYIIFTYMDISFFTFKKKKFTCDMQPYIFTSYDEEKLEDKHLCKSLYFIKPLVTSLTRIGPTLEKH